MGGESIQGYNHHGPIRRQLLAQFAGDLGGELTTGTYDDLAAFQEGVDSWHRVLDCTTLYCVPITTISMGGQAVVPDRSQGEGAADVAKTGPSRLFSRIRRDEKSWKKKDSSLAAVIDKARGTHVLLHTCK